MALKWYTVVVDCHDPQAQAHWWAEALDWQRRKYEDAMDRWHRLGKQADQLLTTAKRTGRKTLRVHDFTEHTCGEESC